MYELVCFRFCLWRVWLLRVLMFNFCFLTTTRLVVRLVVCRRRNDNKSCYLYLIFINSLNANTSNTIKTLRSPSKLKLQEKSMAFVKLGSFLWNTNESYGSIIIGKKNAPG